MLTDANRLTNKHARDADVEPASKRRKIQPEPSSQPTKSSFADVLAKLKEEAQESQGACEWSFAARRYLMFVQRRKAVQIAGHDPLCPQSTQGQTPLVSAQSLLSQAENNMSTVFQQIDVEESPDYNGASIRMFGVTAVSIIMSYSGLELIISCI